MVVAIIIAVVALAIVLFFVMRSRGNAQELENEAPVERLPEPAAKKPEKVPAKEPEKVAAKEPEKAPARAREPEKAPADEKRPRPEPAAPRAPAEPEPASREQVRAAEQRPAAAVEEPIAPAPQPTATAVVEAPIVAGPEPVAPPARAPAKAGPSLPPPAGASQNLSALRKGLTATRGGWVQKLVGLFGGKKSLDPQLLQEIEETLIVGDVGVKTTQALVEALKARLDKRDLSDEGLVWSTLRDVAREVIDVKAPAFGASAPAGGPLVVLVVGVNGVGKTTTIGKLASRYKEQGKKVYLAAGDTFRAAAVAQLEVWGKRVGVPVIKGKDLSKPGAVVFDAVQKGVAETADVVIGDTAGRLHTKTPLMDELRKLRDAAAKAMPGAPHEILLVLDSTTGQNGITQVKEFREALPLTGLVLTKLDGTAKGGVILGICDEFKLPVRFVGVGEKVDDLREFDAEDFTQALFSKGGDDVEAA